MAEIQNEMPDKGEQNHQDTVQELFHSTKLYEKDFPTPEKIAQLPSSISEDYSEQITQEQFALYEKLRATKVFAGTSLA